MGTETFVVDGKQRWAIYHNPPESIVSLPNVTLLAPVLFETKNDADNALELAERLGLRWAYVDKA